MSSSGGSVTFSSRKTLVSLKYLGDSRFKVVKSENSQLAKDDEFEATSFILGFPLYIPRILRNGKYTPSYIAGGDEGLTVIEIN